jgi:hypothetical protein
MLQRILPTTSSSVLQSLTGLSRREFDQLLVSFARAWQDAEADRWHAAPRRRHAGGGRKGWLPSQADKLCFILFYVRQYPVQRVQAVLFGMSKSQADAWIHRLLPVLERTLGHAVALPLRPGASMEQMRARCPELLYWLDGTERPMLRPQDADRQQRHYSGKKKRHTLKNSVVADSTRRIVFVGKTVEGKRHDKQLAEDDAPPFPAKSRAGADSGYQGYHPTGVTVTTPTKKPRGGALTEEEQAANRRLAQLRVVVENALGGTKINRIVHDTFRGRKPGFDDQALLVSVGLHNYRCDQRPGGNAQQAA